MLNTRQGLPIGQQSFEILRRRNKVYVDKTRQLMEIADTLEFCFLSRPRRFGKSLMISTLEAMFQGKAELFKGLAAEEWVREQAKQPCPVLHFDMSKPDKSSLEGFSRDLLNYQIKRDAKILGLSLASKDETGFTGIGGAFDELIFEAYEKYGEVVVLIDEYDSPIAHNIDNPERVEKIRETLNSFYQVLKGSSQYLKFVMVTGISKFSKLSLFSAGNNLVDISMDSEWGTLVGFTQKELEENFWEWITNFAQAQGSTSTEIIQHMKDYYDGFCFDGEHHVYNPWSVLECLRTKQLDSYWYKTATPSYLVKSLKKFGMGTVDQYEGVVVNKNFTSAKEIENATPESFLYQAGYLTIKKREGASLTLGYPNFEVRQALSMTYLEQFYGVKNFQAISDRLLLALNKGDIKAVEELFNEALSAVAYENISKAGNGEPLYHCLLEMLLTSAGVIAPSEVQNAVGRSDVMAFTGRFLYVLEIKIAKNKTQVSKMLTEAGGQIQRKRYTMPFLNKGKTVISVAVVVDVKRKQAIMQETGRTEDCRGN